MRLCLLVLLLLAGCGGNNPPPVLSGNVITFPSNPPGASYVLLNLGTVPKVGQTIALNFSVTGNPTWAQNPNYSPPDTNPPTFHFLLQRKGDNGQCDAITKQYRMFGGRTDLVLGSPRTVSVLLDPSLWTGCYGEKDTAAQFDDLLGNLQSVGVTFGGQSFAGHGVYVSSGSAQFVINNFTVQ